MKEVDMLNRAKGIHDKLIDYRHDFHQHPEVGFHEFRTSAKVAEVLTSLGCQVRQKVGKTGVVAELGQGMPIVAIRADMDALPLQEENKTTYASQNPGVMHACGHDAHTAILLGVAELLSREEQLQARCGSYSNLLKKWPMKKDLVVHNAWSRMVPCKVVWVSPWPCTFPPTSR